MDEQKVREAYELADNITDDFKPIIELREKLKQALAPEPRFYIGQPVLVRNETDDDKNWFQMHLQKLSPFITANDDTWTEVKPDLDAVSLPNWIEHDGSDKKIKSEGALINIMYKNNTFSQYSNVCQIGASIARYCIIPLPVYLNRGSE